MNITNPIRFTKFFLRNGLFILSLIILTSCGGGSGGAPAPQAAGGGGAPVNAGSVSYAIGGTLTGLYVPASGVVNSLLLRNKTNNALVALKSNGVFSFSASVVDGSQYDIEISRQPGQPIQTCTVSLASGTISAADISNITVQCQNLYNIGGDVSGLNGTGLVLQNNDGDDLDISTDGSFTFKEPLSNGGLFDVSVVVQPTNPNQTCAVSQASGTVSAIDISNITVQCLNLYNIGGKVFGLKGAGLVLQNNQGDDLNINADGIFTFNEPLSDRSLYNVTVTAQPTTPNQTCVVNKARDLLNGGDSTKVEVQCSRWTKVSPLTPTPYSLNDIAYNGQIRVAVGDLGEIITSIDGTQWNQQNAVTIQNLNKIIWSSQDNQFVAVGEKGVILASKDGLQWSKQQSGVNASITGIARHDTQQQSDIQYVAVGAEPVATGFLSVLLTSSNGVNWSQQDKPASDGEFLDVSSNGQRFVVVGAAASGTSAVVLSSDNGVDWARQTAGLGSGGRADAIAWSIRDKQFVAVGANVSIVSDDGLTWIENKITPNTPFTYLKFVNNQYIAVNSQAIWSSNNGIAWTMLYKNNSRYGASSLIWDGNVYLAVGEKGIIITSPDASVWTAQNTVTLENISAIAYGSKSNEFIMSIGEQGDLLSSTDGLVWQKDNSGFPGYLTAIVDGGQTIDSYLAVGYNGLRLENFFNSWYEGFNFGSQITTDLYGIAHNNQRATEFYQSVAVGNAGVILLKKDRRINIFTTSFVWQQESSDTSANLYAVIWDGAQYIAVGDTILTSSNGVNWVTQNKLSDGSLLDIVKGEGIVISVGNGGITTSTDGKNWSLVTNTLQYDFVAVEWNGLSGLASEYIAAGIEQMFSSSDGLNWVKEKGINASQQRIAWNSTLQKFMLVGQKGEIYLSQ